MSLLTRLVSHTANSSPTELVCRSGGRPLNIKLKEPTPKYLLSTIERTLAKLWEKTVGTDITSHLP